MPFPEFCRHLNKNVCILRISYSKHHSHWVKLVKMKKVLTCPDSIFSVITLSGVFSILETQWPLKGQYNWHERNVTSWWTSQLLPLKKEVDFFIRKGLFDLARLHCQDPFVFRCQLLWKKISTPLDTRRFAREKSTHIHLGMVCVSKTFKQKWTAFWEIHYHLIWAGGTFLPKTPPVSVRMKVGTDKPQTLS